MADLNFVSIEQFLKDATLYCLKAPTVMAPNGNCDCAICECERNYEEEYD